MTRTRIGLWLALVTTLLLIFFFALILEDLLSPDEKKTLYAPALLQSLNSPNETIRANAATFLKRVVAAKAGIK